MAGGCYVAASMIMVLMNKAVLSAFQFECPNFLVFAQCVTAVLFVKAAEAMGKIDPIEPFNMEVRTPFDRAAIVIPAPYRHTPAPNNRSRRAPPALVPPFRRRSSRCGSP